MRGKGEYAGKSGNKTTDWKKSQKRENFAFVFGASPGKFVLANTSMITDIITLL